jgi:predicted MFS family arabinose efflux permease
VYPTFLSAVADATPPQERSERLGTFRLVRDLGYVAGAIASGYAADAFGLSAAVVGVGVLTLVAAAPFVFNKASSSPVPARGAIRRTRGVFS